MKKEILHLTLHRRWFEKIASGEKIKEYRDIKPYWERRLENRTYDEIWFKNGYARNAPFMRVEWKGMEKENEKFVIILGKVLEIRNFNILH